MNSEETRKSCCVRTCSQPATCSMVHAICDALFHSLVAHTQPQTGKLQDQVVLLAATAVQAIRSAGESAL
jgi:hypothetical protein